MERRKDAWWNRLGHAGKTRLLSNKKFMPGIGGFIAASAFQINIQEPLPEGPKKRAAPGSTFPGAALFLLVKAVCLFRLRTMRAECVNPAADVNRSQQERVTERCGHGYVVRFCSKVREERTSATGRCQPEEIFLKKVCRTN